MSNRSDELHELLSFHGLMLHWAKLGKWVDVAAAEKVRQERLQNFFREPVEKEYVEEVRSALESMLGINDRIMALVKKSRGGVSKDIGSIQKGRRALAAYGQNTEPAPSTEKSAHSW